RVVAVLPPPTNVKRTLCATLRHPLPAPIRWIASSTSMFPRFDGGAVAGRQSRIPTRRVLATVQEASSIIARPAIFECANAVVFGQGGHVSGMSQVW
ncbi:unnamed protein product, partial [Scytosiphon promiscuus]